MQTTENIDEDVKALHGELDRHDGKRSFSCNRRCKYILGVVFLLLFMFTFGMLTRPAPVKVVVTEVKAVLDTNAPRVVDPELTKRLLTLNKESHALDLLVPSVASTGALPSILTWTPGAVGKVNSDESPVTLVGSYEIPAGWFGAIRLLSDGIEIGSTDIDARALQTSGKGRFAIDPDLIEGEHNVKLIFDTVKGCRIACAPGDALCMSTNVNYCRAQYDNQVFLSYAPVTAESQPPVGSCVTKTFVAGPKYAPQIPEDYNMCAQGKWNTNIAPEALTWLIKNHASEVKSEDTSAFLSSVVDVLVGGDAHGEGRSGNLSWTVSQNKGDATTQNMCSATLKVSLNCVDASVEETPAIQASALPHKLSFLEKVKEVVIGKTAYASGNCSAVIKLSSMTLPVAPSYVTTATVVVSSDAACILYAMNRASALSDSNWNGTVFSHSYVQGPASPGICGPANGGVSATMPGARCASPWGSTVGPNTPTDWNWTCVGDNGGLPASCSALVIPSTAPTSPVGNWYRYQGDDCDGYVGVAPASGWIGDCPFGFFAEPSGQWGPACDNSAFSAMYGGPFVGTWNCQVPVPSGYGGSGYGCTPPSWLGGGVYHNYSCNGSVSPIPGVCGTGAGIPTATEPTGGTACGTGTLIPNIPADTAADWKWTCNGVTGSGGGAVICSAPKSAAPPPPVLPSMAVPPSLNFNTVPVGAGAYIDRPLVIINDGTLPITGGSVVLPSLAANPNVTYTCQSGSNCTNFSIPVGIGSSITLIIRAVANFAGSLNANAVVSSNAGSSNVSFVGTGDDKTILSVLDVGAGYTAITPAYPTKNLNPVAVSDPAQDYDFVIRNTGSFNMSYTVTIPIGGPEYTLLGQCAGTVDNLAPDKICTVHFNPSVGAGTRNATIRFNNTTSSFSPPQTLDVKFVADVSDTAICRIYPGSSNPPLSVTQTPPSPASPTAYNVNFGSVNLNSYIDRTITIVNEGDLPLSGTLVAPPGAPYTISPTTPATFGPIPKNGQYDITIRFAPTLAGGVCPGPNCKSFDITTTDPSFPGGKVTVNLSGVGNPTPDLTVTPGAGGPISWTGTGNLPFADQDVYIGPSAPKIISIKNIGSSPTTVTLLVNEPSYTITPVTDNNIPIGGTRDFEVRFDPAPPPSSHSGTITITATGLIGTTQIFVNGNGIIIPPALGHDNPIDFGRVIVNKTKDKTTNIINNDTRDFGAPGVTISGPDAAFFSCISGCTPNPVFSPGPGLIKTFGLRFTPDQVRTFNAVMTFSGGQNGINTVVIPIIGQGIRPIINYKEN